MSASEILDELPNLTKRDREEIRLKLAEPDGDGWDDDADPLSAGDKLSLQRASKRTNAIPQPRSHGSNSRSN
ncbi:MAG TPA: hypothetical protein VFC44_11405 [Candidatus Saccharimonadales bacterium]|nr:hypothetical protein [Candidatus Saccharimonadales bacterium]